ncbi:amidohydrolase family protein [Haliangium ochraceum]|uniref:Amidohydrolase 2 n=1 Tax=Haliangium ochraceum (strain DSM 14365 / JCM 11303 / SMP-2) TaxID=502025 RepID=D0LUR9_HALO1|nr:amidohydrolase family protein [Haliangium ochraceum]ACY13959.1 amidohydrolase 2 [Haliangium ochraceum DSM 14365]
MHASLRRSIGAFLVAALLAVAACREPTPPAGEPAASTPAEPAGNADDAATANPANPAAEGPLDAHVHLTSGATELLLATLDELGVAQAVILASPHLDIAREPAALSEYRAANELILNAASEHRQRLIPFVTVDLGNTEPAYLRETLERGACGVKIYQGHRALRERPLAAPEHHAIWALLEEREVPVLLHLNTVRFRDDLDQLVHAFPKLRLLCAHLCGSRTDLDRLDEIMKALPTLLFDTSHGGPVHGAAGFANLEREHDRIVAMIQAAPDRFVYGSDLVTLPADESARSLWLTQMRGNLGFVRDAAFRFWRHGQGAPSNQIGSYRGLALPEPVRAKVLRGNAERWLAPCLKVDE